MEDEFTSYVEFENEDGETIELAICDYFEYEDEMYVILADEGDDENEEEVEVCVLKVLRTDEGEEFVEPDEEKIPELQRIVEKIFFEADGCDCGCEDDNCDCHDDNNCGCHDDDNCGCHDNDDCGCGCGHHHHKD